MYTCKATNDYGSEMSSAGELKIKGNTNVSTVVYSSNYREPDHGVPSVLAWFSHRVTEQKKKVIRGHINTKMALPPVDIFRTSDKYFGARVN